MSIFGGQPSITTPMPPPCDSPKVVTRKSWPKVLPIYEHCSTGMLPAGPMGVSPANGRLGDPSLRFSNRFEGDLQIVNQIAHVFDANRHPDQGITDSECFTLLRR